MFPKHSIMPIQVSALAVSFFSMMDEESLLINSLLNLLTAFRGNFLFSFELN